MLLELDRVEARYGPVKALHGVTLQVGEGEIVALLGANGAGKTTTLRAISGTVARSGAIRFGGRSLLGVAAEDAARMGIAHVPEGRGTLIDLTVLENLQLGAHIRRDGAEVKRDLDAVYRLFPVLRERRGQAAGTLSGGEQQMLAIGRALMSRPKLLLLDEPSLGLAPLVVRAIFEIVRAINQEQGVAVLLVEQNANLALAISSRGYVLETGRVIVEGAAGSLAQQESVRRSYLGA